MNWCLWVYTLAASLLYCYGTVTANFGFRKLYIERHTGFITQAYNESMDEAARVMESLVPPTKIELPEKANNKWQTITK